MGRILRLALAAVIGGCLGLIDLQSHFSVGRGAMVLLTLFMLPTSTILCMFRRTRKGGFEGFAALTVMWAAHILPPAAAQMVASMRP